MPRGNDVSVAMRHDLRARLARSDFLSSDNERNLDLFRRHPSKLIFESLAFAGSGRERADGFIERNWNSITHDSTSLLQFKGTEHKKHKRHKKSPLFLCLLCFLCSVPVPSASGIIAPTAMTS